MSIEKVKRYFEKFNLNNRIQEFNQSSATVDLAAKALNCRPELIAKTLSFYVNDEPILIVIAGDTKIDNSKFKTMFMTKARMLKPDEVESKIGHAIGGVCPFAIKENIKVYLDESLRRFEYVYPACGSNNSAIKLSISELEMYSNFNSWIDVCKKIEIQ